MTQLPAGKEQVGSLIGPDILVQGEGVAHDIQELLPGNNSSGLGLVQLKRYVGHVFCIQELGDFHAILLCGSIQFRRVYEVAPGHIEHSLADLVT